MQAFEVALNFTEPPGREPMRLPNEGCDQYAAWPANAGARGETSATANLDGPYARRPTSTVGRDEGTATCTNKGTG